MSTPDQDATDFTKALNVLDSYVNELDVSHIIVICENSGRFDQIIANINTLFENNQKPQDIARPVYILTSNSVTWLLSPTSINSIHEIHIPNDVKKQWCSLVPISNSAIVTTTGLKWNLENSKMEFGGIVSTSNTYDDKFDVVKVATDSPLVWSMGIENED
jgi:thiamine pyrophosphokinase